MIHQHYFPEMAGTARRTKELAEEFSKLGYKVTVITSFPREYRSIPGYSTNRIEVINGVDIYRMNTIVSVNIGVITRIVSYLAFVLFGLKWIIKNKGHFDILISIAPIAAGIIGALSHKFLKMYHHFDVPDILPDLGIAAGMIKNRTIISLFFSIERWVYKNCNSISAITKGQVNNIINKGVSPKKVGLIPDWIDVKFFKKNIRIYADQIKKDLSQRFGDQKVISFIGNIGALQNPTIFLDLMKLLNADYPDKYCFLFIGDGIMLPTLKKRVVEENIENIVFIGRIKRELVPAYMHSSDILVANYLNNYYMDICIPGKLYEYLVSGSPIVVGGKGEVADFVNNYNAGISVEPSNHFEIKKAIISIIDGGKTINNANILRFSEKYDLSSVVTLYTRIFKQLTNVGSKYAQ